MKTRLLLYGARTGALRPYKCFPLRIQPSSGFSGLPDNSNTTRLSRFWTPTGGIAADEDEEGSENIHALLVRAGYIRQSHSGLYQFLPLGLRVQQKIERLIDKHMEVLGASKLSLSSLSSEDLWRRSGRLQGDRSELFQLTDRKGTKYLLSPTHEEEITSLVASLVHSHRDLPLRLYQTTRKYRDEPRPRGGLLRSREFLMNDLYTFDQDEASAMATYNEVQRCYNALFTELRLPVFSAAADSGSIGGSLSHEYHLPSPLGEDEVRVCGSCKWRGNVEILPGESCSPSHISIRSEDVESSETPGPIISCPNCSDPLPSPNRCIEFAHTFHLGTKYTAPLAAHISSVSSPTSKIPIQMGCHGIGVSRLIAGAASHFSDAQGLGWPRVIAPFDILLVLGKSVKEADGLRLAKRLLRDGWDVAVDDRARDFGWKMKDADLIGYPVIVVLGREWKDGSVEIQCRRQGIRESVRMGEMPQRINELMQTL